MEPLRLAIHNTQRSLTMILLLLFVVGGFVMTFLLPPFQVPDENVHWTAGYQRVERLVTLYRPNPRYCLFANTLPQHFEVGRIAFKPGEKVSSGAFGAIKGVKRACAPVTLSYGFVGSYPGILAARAIVSRENSKPERSLHVFYLSRLLQGAVVALLMLRLLSLVRASETVLPGILTTLVLSVSPLMLQQSFAISADTIVLALSISLIILIFYWWQSSTLDWAVLITLSAAVGLTKPPALPPLIVAVLVGYWLARRKSDGPYWRGRLAFAAVIMGLITGGWMTLQDHSPPAHQYMGRELGVGKQLSYIAASPIESFVTVNNGFLSRMTLPALSGPLGWLDTPLSKWTMQSWCLLLSFALLLDLVFAMLVRREGARQFAALAVGLYLSGFALSLALFLTWTTVGGGVVEGLQGRYFLPIALLLPTTFFGLVSASIGGRITEARVLKWRLMPAMLSLIFGLVGVMFLMELALDLLKRYW